MAEIAVAIAGFSGIAAVLGRRSEGEWAPLDVMRFRWLLRSSFAIVIFSLLPIVLRSASVTGTTTWALSSGAFVVWFVTAFALDARRFRRITKGAGEPIEQPQAALMLLLTLGILALHCVNAVVIHEVWPYLAGLVAMLMYPFVHFFYLMRVVLGPKGAA